MTELRAVVVIDYQNVHLTARDLFGAKGRPTHESLVDPLHFANQLILSRNDAQRSGSEHATLVEVLVFRGEPVAVHDPKAYSRSQAQRSQWERDPRVKVTLRSLRYDYERDVNGRKVIGPDGKWIVKGRPREKGIDVLCALAVVRCAHNPAFDLVILASQDTDLAPCLDEARSLGKAKIETFCWFDPQRPYKSNQIKPQSGYRLWNTRLNATGFDNCLDRTTYT